MATKFAGIGLNEPLKVKKTATPLPAAKIAPTLGSGNSGIANMTSTQSGSTPFGSVRLTSGNSYTPPVASNPKDAYINSQLPTVSAPTSINSSALSQLDSMRQQAMSIQSQLQQQSPSSNRSISSPSAPTLASASVKPQPSTYDMAAKDYIKSLGESDRVTAARQKYLNFIQSRDQGLQNIEDQTIPMQFITGQQRSLANRAEIQGARLQGDVALAQEQQQANQQQAKTLLDFEAEKQRMLQDQTKPIEVGGSLLQFNPATGQYDSIYTAPQDAADGFTLSEGQTRYDAQGNPVASAATGTSPAKIVSINGKDYIQNADGTFTEPPVPGAGQPSETTQNAISVIDQILSRDTNAIAGIPSITSYLPGTSSQLTKTLAQQLNGILSLENRQLLKGSGAISDYEFKVLSQAASALGIDKNGRSALSNADFKAQLQKLKEDLAGSQITTPDGLRWKKLPDGSYEQITFNSVGNTSVSIPASSRLAKVNNNPGNLKFAGQPGAVKGEGGFAKFSSPAAGLNALYNQVKLDASRGLTLAQFIYKYAPPTENDTNRYIQQVAMATSSLPGTRISAINPDLLVRAVANKESSTKII